MSEKTISQEKTEKTTKPVSDKKIEANRKNAKKSTGPRTPAGKARSASNAFKHGLLAQHILLYDSDPDEKESDFNILYDGLMAELQPRGFQESFLVERIVTCYWRLRRAYRHESQAIVNRRDTETGYHARLANALSGERTDPYKFILPAEADLKNLLRYESMIDRQLNRCLADLHQLQSRHQGGMGILPMNCHSRESGNPSSSSPLEQGETKGGDPPIDKPIAPNEPNSQFSMLALSPAEGLNSQLPLGDLCVSDFGEPGRAAVNPQAPNEPNHQLAATVLVTAKL